MLEDREGRALVAAIHERKRKADMTDQLAAIESRANAATEGPWYVDDEEQTVRAREHAGEIVYDRSAEHRTEWAAFKPTAEFIAHARTDVPDLLALVREQAAKLDLLTLALEEADEKCCCGVCGL
jgi:tRNA(Ile2) C34 agmatinyltransferase TiaS